MKDAAPDDPRRAEGPGRAPGANGPDHALAIVVGVALVCARLHADRHDVRRGEQPHARRLRRHRLPSSRHARPRSGARRPPTSRAQAPTVAGRRLERRSARAQASALAVGDITDTAQIIGTRRQAASAPARTSASASTPRTPGAERLDAVPAARRHAGRPGPARSSSTPPRAKSEHYAVGDTIRVAARGAARETPRSPASPRFGDVKSLGKATAGDLRPRDRAHRCSPRTATTGSWSPAAAPTATRRAAAVRDPVAHGARRTTASPSTRSSSSIEHPAHGPAGVRGAWRCSSARSRSSTRSRSPSPSAREEFGLLRMVGATPPPGALRRPARGAAHRAARVGRRASASASASRPGLNALFAAVGMDLPTEALELATRTIVVSLLVGTLATIARRPRSRRGGRRGSRRWPRCATHARPSRPRRLRPRGARRWRDAPRPPVRRSSAARPARSPAATRCATPAAPRSPRAR